ncbi:MAG TPA: Smr/MutS family protein [Candidatus Limnocylindrales bacterium]|nr:Smr/MutS family protein [Candidatus Limnocylindrales bacterium]
MDLVHRTLEVLDWPFVTEAMASHARTPAGRERALRVDLARDVPTVEESFDAIDEVFALVDRRAGMPPVGGIEPIDGQLERAARGEVLATDEIAFVASTLGALASLEDFVRRHSADAPALARLGAAISPDRRLCRTFAAAIDEHGMLSQQAWPVLGELRRRIASLERSIRTTLEALLDSPEYADVLQDRFVTVRGDRFVVPVKSHARNLGLGIVHDASRSERTVFVEPASIVPIGNERRMAESALAEEERRILAELSAELGGHAAALRAALDGAAALDLACARTDFAARIDGHRPRVGTDGIVALERARHPVLALGRASVVANDLRLDSARPVLVLTGPNAGGKTVAMKTIGLCALLVRAGCFIPAAGGSRVDIFDPVLADIGDMQTVHEGLSSFSAHLATLARMLETAGRGTLLLLDEIAAGTDPAQGGALARAILERFADAGARIVVTTHYTQVKRMGADDPRVEVSALEYADGKPTYRVVPGSVGESHALAAAGRAGIDSVLIERARELMDAGERALADALAALEAEKTRAAEAATRAEALAQSLALREHAVAAREEEIRGRAKEVERRAASKLVDTLRAAEDDVRRAVRELRENTSRERADAARAAIETARSAIAEARRDNAAPPRQPKPGDKVRVTGVGLVGEVVEARDGELEIRAGAMTVRAKVSEVEVLAAPRAVGASPAQVHSEPKPRRASGDWLDAALRMPANTLDLRGVRVEEGLARLEEFLDESMLASREVVFVLHGHGSGAMKSAVRRALSQSPYVSATAPAPEDQGGDALTVSRLRG